MNDMLFADAAKVIMDTPKPERIADRQEFVIDPGFRSLIPALSEDELQQLESNILADGCRDPLTVWNGLLLDGHNRFDICTRHGIPYQVVTVELADRFAAQEWIIRNQFGRRNLLPYVRTQLALKLEDVIAARARENQGTRTDIPQKSAESVKSVETRKEIAKIAGVSHDTVAKVKKIEERATPEVKAALSKGEMSINQAHTQIARAEKEANRESRRDENRAKIAAVPEPGKALGDVKYATIMIDPPWDWGDEGDQDQLGRARPQYSTMSFEELLDFDVAKFADVDCHIYLWITNRSLPKGFALLDRWGFRYVTALTWVKPHFGMGNYFRGQTEHVLFGVKGSQPLKVKDVGTAFHAPRGPGGHSSKPVEFYDLVEKCSPDPYLEMFSRSDRPNWTPWGENSGQ